MSDKNFNMQENLCYLDWKFNKSMLKYLIFFKNQNPYHPICFFKTHFNFSHCSWQYSKILILYTCFFKSNYQLIFFSRLPKSQFAGLWSKLALFKIDTKVALACLIFLFKGWNNYLNFWVYKTSAKKINHTVQINKK